MILFVKYSQKEPIYRMITFHADDYGINIEQSKRILDCRKSGVLNSVSIMGNSTNLEMCIGFLDGRCKKSIHINLNEGHCLSAKQDIPLLVGKEGVFDKSFLQLLLISFVKRQELERQTYKECLAQIKNVISYLPGDYKIRVDSHVHYHMIPAIFCGLCKALGDSGKEIEYIRYPVENLFLYLRTPSIWKFVKPINIIKIIIINICGLVNKATLKKYGFQSKITQFFGVIFTGHMNVEAVKLVLKKILKKNSLKNGSLEILFHPGGIEEREEFLDRDNRQLVEFYKSQDRKDEAMALKSLEMQEVQYADFYSY